MESLIGYGSDDDYDEHSHGKKQSTSQADANYEEVQMDLSEDSNDSPKFDNRRQSKDYHSKYKDELTKEKEYKDKYKKHYDDDRNKYEHSRSSPKSQDSRYKDKSRDRRKEREDRRSRDREDRRSRDREDRRSRDREDRRSRDREDRRSRDHEDRRSRDHEDRRSRDREDRRSRDREDRRSRDREDRRSRDREDRRDRDDRHSFDDDRDYKKDRNRDEKAKYRDDRTRDNRKGKEDQERYSHRGSSRERDRHRSRSPKRSKRSSSRERTRVSYTKRHDRSGNKMDRLEKLDLNSGPDSAGTSTETNNDKSQEKNRFFMPGITGRFTEQIQRRKLLWQKKEAVPSAEVVNPSQTQKVWQNTTFAQDTDGKVANKFKRLMGIKGNQSATPKPANDSLRKQEEMFTSMEAQYEVARTATHTMRGVGLGFGAFQR